MTTGEHVMSSDKFEMTTGQAHELAMALGRNDWTNAEVKKLCEGNLLSGVRSIVHGLAKIKPILHLIDCDAAPFIPDGWNVEEHRNGGQFAFSQSAVNLYLSKNQKGDKRIEGAKLRAELAKKPVLNANVLDYLLKPENRHLIPIGWKDVYVFFWGTVYHDSSGNLYVRCLYWDGGRWHWLYSWLDDGWSSPDPAAVLAR